MRKTMKYALAIAAILLGIGPAALAESGRITQILGPDPGRNCEFFLIDGVNQWYALALPQQESSELLLTAYSLGRPLSFWVTGQQACGYPQVTSFGLQ